MILNCGYRSWTDVWLVLNGDRGVPSNLQGTVEAFAECNLAELQHKFQAHRGQVAAVFLDIQRSAPPVGYLAAVKELCHTNWALLVYDEIVTGFRLALGEMQEYCGVMPDLACFAKALSNGMQSFNELGPAIEELRSVLSGLNDITTRLEEDPAGFLLGDDNIKEYQP